MEQKVNHSVIDGVDFLEVMSEFDIAMSESELDMKEVYDFSDEDESGNAVAGELDAVLSQLDDEVELDSSIKVDEEKVIVETTYPISDGVEGKLFSMYLMADNSIALIASHDPEEAMDILNSVSVRAQKEMEEQKQEEGEN